jgi:aspartate-semialdehyde dehydrogenase
MSQNFDVAIAGATGLLGETLLELLDQRRFPVASLTLLGEGDEVGESRSFRGKQHDVKAIDGFDFSACQLAFFVGGEAMAETHAVRAADAGCVVIDSSRAFAYDDAVPLIIPEVNALAIADYSQRGILRSPDCDTILLWSVLHECHAHYRFNRLVLTVCQAVSRQGQAGIEELARQTTRLLNAQPLETKIFPRQIAFNLLPVTSSIVDSGYSADELLLMHETRRLLLETPLEISPTVIQAPVFFGDTLLVHVEADVEIDIEEIADRLQQTPGVSLATETDAARVPTPVTHAAGQATVHVSRLRPDLTRTEAFSLVVSADCTHKGGALNSVQIAEILVKDYL